MRNMAAPGVVKALVLLAAISACGTDSQSLRRVPMFFDPTDRLLNPEDLQKSLPPHQDAGWSVTPEAKTWHELGRAAGAEGDYNKAIAHLTKSAGLAPRWPYPIYDRAFTYLLMKQPGKALEDYRKTLELAPRGFFTAMTAVHTLTREEAGDLPPGLYLAFMTLESVEDATQRRGILQQFVDKYPTFAPGWYKYATVQESLADRLTAIERGLAADPDPQTKGMLLLNKALVLHGAGDYGGSQALLRSVADDPQSTLATEALAKAMVALAAKQ